MYMRTFYNRSPILEFTLHGVLHPAAASLRPRQPADAPEKYFRHHNCGSWARSANHANRKKTYTPYYECYRLSKYKGFPCEVRRINAEALEESFRKTLEKLSWDQGLVAKAVEELLLASPDDTELRQKVSALHERRNEVERKITNVLSAIEDGLAGSSVQGRLRELEDQKVILQSEIGQLRLALDQAREEPLDVQDMMTLFRMCSEMLPTMTPDLKEALVDTILQSATVQRDKTVEFAFYADDDAANVVQNVKAGSPAWTRTTNPLVNSQVLCQLSYRGTSGREERPATDIIPSAPRFVQTSHEGILGGFAVVP